MAKRLGKLGWVDDKFEFTISKVKRKFHDVGIEGISDRQATRVIANVFENIDFDIRPKSRKRRKKFEIVFK